MVMLIRIKMDVFMKALMRILMMMTMCPTKMLRKTIMTVLRWPLATTIINRSVVVGAVLQTPL